MHFKCVFYASWALSWAPRSTQNRTKIDPKSDLERFWKLFGCTSVSEGKKCLKKYFSGPPDFQIRPLGPMFLKHFYFWLTSHFESLWVPLGPPFREVFRLGGFQDAVFEGFWPFKKEMQKQCHFSIDFLSILVPSWRPTWLPKPSQNRPQIVPNRIFGPTWRPRGPRRLPDPSRSVPGTNF